MDVPIAFAGSAPAIVFVTILVLELRSQTTTAKLLPNFSSGERRMLTTILRGPPTRMIPPLLAAVGDNSSDERPVAPVQLTCNRQAGQGRNMVASNQQTSRMTGGLFEADGARINAVGSTSLLRECPTV